MNKHSIEFVNTVINFYATIGNYDQGKKLIESVIEDKDMNRRKIRK